ncbi:MAG: cation acetate symporter [bacterium]|nr:cation acetate symporter [bacterium]
MNLHGSMLSTVIFGVFVALVLWMSYYFARRARSAAGYFAAGGQIHWAVNGISFAGDYLSAASFLGICGMIATLGYDGFLYSIGYLAGWVVALFVVAEPMKRMGKFTFTDALDAKFDHRGIKLAAAISTLVVSICYLIPQMNGAGSLVEPLLGLPHWVGVVIVGIIVITIVATAGMTSTTYVQFLKGGLLLIFSTILVVVLMFRGIDTDAKGLVDDAGEPLRFTPVETTHDGLLTDGYTLAHSEGDFSKYSLAGKDSWWVLDGDRLFECQWETADLVNGEPDGLLEPVGRLRNIGGVEGESTGRVSIVSFLSHLTHPETRIEQWHKTKVIDEAGTKTTVYYPKTVNGTDLMKPGAKFKVKTGWEKLNFVSLMLALFLGTAALPHILIRYYTVPSPACARKSTIVAIAAIGFFYVLTLFMGLGAGISGTVNPADNNMSAPLLALSFGGVLFAIISAIAFATVLGTVAGLIVAASGAVAHDLMDRFGNMNLGEREKVRAGKIAAFGVGIIAIVLGIVFRGVNVSFLVGWAFAVAASANLPSIVMLLFWKKTTAEGITASIFVGIVAALGIILTGPAMFAGPYGKTAADALHPLGQPGIIAIPLSFLTLVVVSLMTQKKKA